MCFFSLVAPEVRAAPIREWISTAVGNGISQEDFEVVWKTEMTLGRWLQDTFPPRLQLPEGTCQCHLIPGQWKIDGHVATFDLLVLSHFSVKPELMEAIQQHHSSCLIVPTDWASVFHDDFAAAVSQWKDEEESLFWADHFLEQLKDIVVPQEQWELLQGGRRYPRTCRPK